MSGITLTIPDDKRHIGAAMRFFAELAGVKTMIPADLDVYRDECPTQEQIDEKMNAETTSYKPESFPGAHDDSFTFPASVLLPGVVPMPPVNTAGAFGLPVPPTPGSIVTTPADLTGMIPTEPPFTGLAMPPAPPVTPISGVKLDSEGLPWDRRINASTKTLRQSDNTWKLIRGVADSLVAQVKAELRVAMGQQTAPTAPAPADASQITLATLPPSPPAPLPNLDDGDDFPPPPGAAIPAAITPPAPVLTLVPPLPPAPPADDPYLPFVQFCTSNQQSGKLEYAAIVSTCQKYGITQLPMLNARHDLIPTIRAELEALCKP